MLPASNSPGNRAMRDAMLRVEIYYDRFFRYPGWLEVIAGVAAGIAWTAHGVLTDVSLADRPGFAVMTAVLPEVWPWIGILLAGLHMWGLFESRQHRRSYRAIAAASSCIFWCYVGYAAIWTAFVRDTNVPALAVPTLVLGSIHFALTVRLWKGYE